MCFFDIMITGWTGFVMWCTITHCEGGETVKAYKLMKLRKDGSLGPLFINRRQHVPRGVWLDAEDHPTKGHAHRPGWHVMAKPETPHLKLSPDRVWVTVEVSNYKEFKRPASQGGVWYLAERMKVLPKEYYIDWIFEYEHHKGGFYRGRHVELKQIVALIDGYTVGRGYKTMERRLMKVLKRYCCE